MSSNCYNLIALIINSQVAVTDDKAYILQSLFLNVPAMC